MILRELFEDSSVRSLFSYDGSFWAFGVDEKAMGVLHSVLTLPFSIAKMLANMVDFAIEKLYTLNLLSNSIDSILLTAQDIWDKFFNYFGLLFFTFVIAYVVKDYYSKSGSRAFMRLIIFFTILGFGNGFFSNGAQWIKDFNAMSGQLQSDLTAVVAPKISELNNSLFEEFGGSGEQSSTDSIRNSFYTMTVLKPWALINFGKTEVSAEKYKELLVVKGEDKKQKQKEIEKALKKESESNYYLTSDSFHEKFFIGLTALVNVIVLGTVVLVISLLNPLLQLVALLLVLIFPILLGISLIPDKEDVAKNAGIMLVSIFFLKGLLGLGFGGVFLIFDIVDRFFGGANLDSFILSFILKIAVLILIWKKRNTLINMANGRKVGMNDFASESEVKNAADILKKGRQKYRGNPNYDEIPEELLKYEMENNSHSDSQLASNQYRGAMDDAILNSTLDNLSTSQIDYYEAPTELSADSEKSTNSSFENSDSQYMTGEDNFDELNVSTANPYISIPSGLIEDEEELKRHLMSNSSNPYRSLYDIESVEEAEKRKEVRKRLNDYSDAQNKEIGELNNSDEQLPQDKDQQVPVMNESPQLRIVDDAYFESLEQELSMLRGEEIPEELENDSRIYA